MLLCCVRACFATECGGRCAARCSGTAYRKPCLFFCRKCCAACLCVPAGTYGNKNTCPCYNNWKTKRGGPKCPYNYVHQLRLSDSSAFIEIRAGQTSFSRL